MPPTPRRFGMREALERNVAALEGGRHGFAFASGLAALDAVMKLLSAGDHVVSGENVYGGSHRQMTHIWSRLGLTFTFVDGGDTAAVAAAVQPNTRMVYAETPTNPMMRLCDLAATGEIARKAKALFVVDNTFASPYLQQPLQLGLVLEQHPDSPRLAAARDRNARPERPAQALLGGANGGGPPTFDRSSRGVRKRISETFEALDVSTLHLGIPRTNTVCFLQETQALGKLFFRKALCRSVDSKLR